MSSFVVHRCQLYKPSTSAINSISVNKKLRKLALTRANGALQVWDTRHGFILEREFPPAESDSCSENVIWCKDRLFTVGFSGFLTEWSLHSGPRPMAEIKISSSQVWCVAKNASESHLIAGTEDGAILKCALTDDNSVLMERPISRTEKRILSLFWHEKGKIIVSGSVNVIRIWDADAGRCLRRISVDGGPVETLVWTLTVTRDSVVVSGDSRGVTSFWNVANGTLINSFKSHKADVLTVFYDEQKNCIFSAGVDPSICQFLPIGEKSSAKKREGQQKGRLERVKVEQKSDFSGQPRFVESARRNLHSRDVRCLAAVDDWLVSGGVDASIGLSRFPPKKYLRLPVYDQTRIHLASEGRFLMFQYETRCEIWKLGSSSDISGPCLATKNNGQVLNLHKEPEKYAEIKASKNGGIIASALNYRGDHVAYSDIKRTRLLKISCVQDDEQQSIEKPKIVVEKLIHRPKNDSDISNFCESDSPAELPPSDRLIFLPGVNRLIASSSTDRAFLVYEFDSGGVRQIDRIAFPDGCSFVTKMFACSSAVGFFTSENDVFILDLENQKILSKLPRVQALAVDARFSSTSASAPGDDKSTTTPLLIVLYADGLLVEYSPADRRYSRCYNVGADSVKGLLVPPANDHQIFVYSTQRLTSVRKELAEDKAKTTSTTDAFADLVFADFLKDGQMVVVQVDPDKFSDRLPPPFVTKKFGTG